MRAPDDSKDTLGYAKAMQESIEANRQRHFIADDENAKWWSAFECGNIIEVDDSDAERGGVLYDDAESSSSSLHTSFFEKLSDDDDEADGSDEADNGATTGRR
jgi:hypothetical protein